MHRLTVPSTAFFPLLFACTIVCPTLAACSADFDTEDDAASIDEDAVLPSTELEVDAASPEQSAVSGGTVSVSDLPFVDPIESAETYLQMLPEPTPSGQNVALHMLLPPPANPALAETLVRVIGGPDNELVVFRTDALVELERVPSSPGPEFFTAFLTLSNEELDRRRAMEEELAEFDGPLEANRLIFSGRSPIALTTGVALDLESLALGGAVALGPCPLMPTSELARWEESLVITDLAAVQDEGRTNDICDPLPDNPDGVWTFKHLMAEMASGSGLSTHDFVVHWLENWINPMVINGDTIPVRMAMLSDVIQPWATLDGLTVSVATIAGRESLVIVDGGGTPAELDLDKAPFRLSAIVNRIDLGNTAVGPSASGGSLAVMPVDAGELRFVFGVQDVNCNVLPFSVIFEYGVPITGCEATRDWALEWTRLNNPNFAPRFSPAWLAHLETLTESVVLRLPATKKGNNSAIHQIRTNENALDSQWEFREFTLSTETFTDDPLTDVDTKAIGPLRPHSVAQTPNDAHAPGVTVFDPTGDPTIDDFLFSVVLPGTTTTNAGLPGPCSASYDLTGLYSDTNGVQWQLRGGNSFTAPPTHWNANINPVDADEACARHQFSLNTCNGCHFADTNAVFFHIDPMISPAPLSDFMTGGAGVGTQLFAVPDSHSNVIPDWNFNDLHRRFERLYEIGCTACGGIPNFSLSLIPLIVELNGSAPIDALVGEPEVAVGPVTDLARVAAIVDAVEALSDPEQSTSVELGQLVRPAENRTH